MSDRFIEACQREFDRLVKDVCFEDEFVQDPINYRPEQRDDYIRRICRALAAQAWHYEHTASYNWASWANPLPLRLDTCESLLQYVPCNGMKLLGYFGRSLRWRDWNYETHPTFPVFCSGVLDWDRCPIELQTDRELARVFPPKPLAGITAPLCWRPPARAQASGAPAAVRLVVSR
jgi:hypothetical protein